MILRLTQFYIPGMRGTPEGLRRQHSQFPFQLIWAEHLEDAISNVDSVMFLIQIVEMVSFELGEGLKKIFLSCHERGISVGAQNLPSLLFFYQKHYAIDIADPNSVWEACYKNFVIGLAHRRVFVAQWLSIGAQIRRSKVDSSWGLRIFLYPTLVTRRKKHLSYLNAFGNL